MPTTPAPPPPTPRPPATRLTFSAPVVPTDRAYPAATPLTDMAEGERTAYWTHHARRHQERARSYLTQLHGVRAALRSGDPIRALALIDPDLPDSTSTH